MRLSVETRKRCLMEAPRPTSAKVDLNQILDQVEQATRSTFKAADGQSYSSVFTKDLRHWASALHEASKDMQGHSVTEKALMAAKDDITQLMRDSEKKDLKIRELKDLVANAEKAAEEQRKSKAQKIKEASEEVIHLKQQLADAELSKVSTAQELSKAEAALKSPDAKFVPEESKRLHDEVVNLRSELALANDMIAQGRVGLHKANVDLDTLRKEAASKDANIIAAKTELSTFKKQVEASKVKGIHDVALDDLDMDMLLVSFGSKGVEKLKAVLEIPIFDVRGRVQKLMGFFATVSKTVSKTFGAMTKVLEHALEVLKSRSTTWTSILLPWVNEIVKDMVFMHLKSAKEYRLELERITGAVKAKLPSAPLKEKMAAGAAAATGESWSSQAKEARSKAAKAGDRLGKAIARLRRRCVGYLRGYAKRVADSIRSAYHGARKVSTAIYAASQAAFKIGWAFFKGSFKVAREAQETEERERFVEEAMEYDLDSKQWVETDLKPQVPKPEPSGSVWG